MTFPIQVRDFRINFRPRLQLHASLLWTMLALGLAGVDPSGLAAAEARPAPGSSPQSTVPHEPSMLTPALAVAPVLTNPVVPFPVPTGSAGIRLITNSLPANLAGFFAPTNALPRRSMSTEELLVHLAQRLEVARYLRTTRQSEQAKDILVELLDDQTPEPIQQAVFLELAAVAQDQNNLSRAQEIYMQFLSKWPNDLRVPEILLRQGMVFRLMGMYHLAFTRFYAVMTSALVLKNDQLDYYIRLVLQAQTEIAETQYELAKYTDAAELFGRLLKQNNSAINRSQILYKLLRCHVALGNYPETVSEAQDFLAAFPDAPELPEVRFYMALALKQLGRNTESLQQVLLLLQEQRSPAKGHPEHWAYWQQRAGNLIANQLYQEADYLKALEIYRSLAQLDRSPQWQVPVLYQIGITYERLWQPQKATESFQAILQHEKQIGTNAPPDLRTVFDMARWRIGFIQWQDQADAANRRIRPVSSTNAAVAASLSSTPAPTP